MKLSLDRLDRLVPRTLTARLVVTVVALVALVGLLVAASATIAMRSYLYDRLDSQVGEAVSGPRLGFPPDGDGPGTSGAFIRPGALTVTIAAGSNTAQAGVTSDEGEGEALTVGIVRHLISLTADGKPHTTTVYGHKYRVASRTDTDGLRIVGLPTADIDSTINSMLRWFALLTLLGVGVAGVGGTWLVRRQMRPLYAVAETAREVSTQDLSTGDTAIETRVPDRLTDEQSEVGQVGSALNTLLDHIDDALAARHKSEQQVRQFVADASHELRTPLATIHGYAELSRRTPDDTKALLLALNKVETEADRMGDLVADLLLLARLDSGRPLAREDVDVTRLLLEAVADARVVAPDHKWQLALPDEPVTVVGDDARLHQVITNLLSNARSHTPAGTTVTVAASTQADEVRIDVHDDGPGLPPDLVDEAFDRFTRGDSSRTRASGGAGLGLSLVSAITEAHSGSAAVSSRPGDTTFTVTLPRG
ncbi:two-component system, OmpR family, sensor kinase [Marmoricola sp. URHA0025 HA25]